MFIVTGGLSRLSSFGGGPRLDQALHSYIPPAERRRSGAGLQAINIRLLRSGASLYLSQLEFLQLRLRRATYSPDYFRSSTFFSLLRVSIGRVF